MTAFTACAVLLVIAIGARAWLELVQRRAQHPSEATVRLPQELRGSAFRMAQDAKLVVMGFFVRGYFDRKAA